MANANNFPLFVQFQRTASTTLTLASTISNNTPGNVNLVGTIGPNGGVLTKVSALPLGTVTAHLIYLFYSKDGGATKQLFAVATVPLYAASTNTASTETLFAYSEDAPKRFAPTDQLYVGLSSAQAAGVIVNFDWGDF